MACLARILAISVLLAPKISATSCVQGSCLEDDVTSLVQVQKIVKKQDEKQGQKAADQDNRRHNEDEKQGQKVEDQKHDGRREEEQEDQKHDIVQDQNQGEQILTKVLALHNKIMAAKKEGLNVPVPTLLPTNVRPTTKDREVVGELRKAFKEIDHNMKELSSKPILQLVKKKMKKKLKHSLQRAFHKLPTVPFNNRRRAALKVATTRRRAALKLKKLLKKSLKKIKKPKPGEFNPYAHVVKRDLRALKHHVHNKRRWEKLARSVLPPPVGHGKVYPNPTVTEWRAESKTIPGMTGGPVVKAYDASRRGQEEKVLERMKRQIDDELGQNGRVQKFRRDLGKQMAHQEDAFQAALQDDKVAIQEAEAKKKHVQQQALDTVARATEKFEKAKIVDNQAKAASIEGAMVGDRVAEERAAEYRQKKLDELAESNMKRQRRAVQLARDMARKDRLTDRARYEKRVEDEGLEILNRRAKEIQAEEALAARNSGLVRAHISGPEAIENSQTLNMANRKAKHLDRMAANAMKDTRDAIKYGAGEVVYSIEAAAATQDLLGSWPGYR